MPIYLPDADRPHHGQVRGPDQTKEFVMTSLLKARVLARAALLAASFLTIPSAQAQQAGITRTDLQRRDLSAPGREAIQVRVDLAPGIAFPNHTHPGEEIIYVLSGTIEYDVAGKPTTLKAGDVLFIPAGTVHAAKNVGNDNASELATYIVEKGKPTLTLAK